MILIYGGSGLVGTGILPILSKKFLIKAPSSTEVDVTNVAILKKNITSLMPSWVVYLAGIASVEAAQTHRDQAYALNARSPKTIAEITKSLDIPLCYISTDAVFDGTLARRAYRETDTPNPTSVYGKSKRAGEQFVLSASKNNLVVRIIMPYGVHFPAKKDFARLVIAALQKKEKFTAISDQIINPLFINDLGYALSTLLEHHASGVYHLGATNAVTNLEFAQIVAHTFHIQNANIATISFNEFMKGKHAPRGQYAWLDTSKFQKEFGNNILHSVKEGIALFKNQVVS